MHGSDWFMRMRSRWCSSRRTILDFRMRAEELPMSESLTTWLPSPKRCTWARFPNLFSLLVIVLLAVNYFSAFSDLDFSWQVRTGERIAHGGPLLPNESFTYTIDGRPVSQFEWLYELVLWLVWSGFGFGGLKLLRTLLVAAPLVLL